MGITERETGKSDTGNRIQLRRILVSTEANVWSTGLNLTGPGCSLDLVVFLVDKPVNFSLSLSSQPLPGVKGL